MHSTVRVQQTQLTARPTLPPPRQATPEAQEFLATTALGQALLSRVEASPVARSLDSAARAAAGVAGAAAAQLLPAAAELAQALGGLGSTAARVATEQALGGVVAAAEATAPLIELRADATRGVAQPVAAAGARLAAASFDALLQQVSALEDPGERDAALAALAPRVEARQRAAEAAAAGAADDGSGGDGGGGGL